MRAGRQMREAAQHVRRDPGRCRLHYVDTYYVTRNGHESRKHGYAVYNRAINAGLIWMDRERRLWPEDPISDGN